MKIALSGAGGFVGYHLKMLFPNHVVIDRSDSQETIVTKLRDVDVVINLAGAPIVKKWTSSYKKVLMSSRIDLTRNLVSAINMSNVKHFISASAIGIYPNNKAQDESSKEIADDFLGTLARQWEREALKCKKLTSILRFGVILGDGGALAKMLPPFKLCLGGIIADGKMMMSWIDIEDLMRMYTFIIEKKLGGIFNATSPNPVTNYTFTKALGSVLHRPTILPLPAFVLRVLFGEGSIVLTGSKEIYPKALCAHGFVFKYETIKTSLRHILK